MSRFDPSFIIKKSIIALSLLIVAHSALFSQKNVIKTDLFGGMLGTMAVGAPTLKLSYERAFKPNLSWQISLEYGKYAKTETSFISSLSGQEIANIKGFGIMPEFRYYLSTKRREAPMGWFLSAHYRYYSLVEHYFSNSYDLKTNGHVNNFGLNLGFKHGGDVFIAEYLLGFGFSSGSWNLSDERKQIESEHEINDLSKFATMRLEINIGFKFPRKN
jgi:hypothetical protein